MIDLCCMGLLDSGEDWDLLGYEVIGDIKQTLIWKNGDKILFGICSKESDKRWIGDRRYRSVFP